MGVLLDAVTLDDWREVVTHAKVLAQDGDPQARAWLSQYLMGKPEGKAPTPLTVVLAQWDGADPLVNQLAAAEIDRHKYPELHQYDDAEDSIKALVAHELSIKMRPADAVEDPDTD
jgi:hypothetical protein